MIDDEPIPPGIAMWSEKTGLMAFPGGGVTLSTDSPFNVTGNLSSRSSVDGKVMALQFESRSQSLFVSGSFHYVNNTPCTTVAVWEMSTNTWTCLYDPIHGISTVTAMLYENNFLFLAGWAAPSSSWDSKLNLAPYTIAVLDIRRYIEDRYKWKIRSPTSVPSPSSFGNSSSNSSCSNCPLNGNDSNNSDIERSPTKAPHSSYGSRRRLRSRGAARSHLRFHGGRRAQGAEVSRKLVTSILPVHTTFNTTSTPSPTPAKGPWTMEWAWLPAFPVNHPHKMNDTFPSYALASGRERPNIATYDGRRGLRRMSFYYWSL